LVAWHTSRRASEQQNTLALAQLRAWIAPHPQKPCVAQFHASNPKDVSFQQFVQTLGGTPALDVSYLNVLSITTTEGRVVASNADEQAKKVPAQISLVPGQEMLCLGQMSFPPEAFDLFASGDAELSIELIIRYRDVSGTLRTTILRSFVTGAQFRARSVSGQLVAHPRSGGINLV